MRPAVIVLVLAALGAVGCTASGSGIIGAGSALERVRASTFPMAQDVWRVSVRSDGFLDRETVEQVALYHAADLTLKRGFERFVVQQASVGQTQRPLSQALSRTGEVAGAAAGIAVPGLGGLVGAGAGTVIGGVDSVITPYGGDILIRMFAAGDPAGASALDAVEMLNTTVNAVRRPR